MRTERPSAIASCCAARRPMAPFNASSQVGCSLLSLWRSLVVDAAGMTVGSTDRCVLLADVVSGVIPFCLLGHAKWVERSFGPRCAAAQRSAPHRSAVCVDWSPSHEYMIATGSLDTVRKRGLPPPAGFTARLADHSPVGHPAIRLSEDLRSERREHPERSAAPPFPGPCRR
jgi:hypothetical protein